MLSLLTVLVALLCVVNANDKRFTTAMYTAVSAVAPSLLSVVDNNHTDMRSFGPYTDNDVANVDTNTSSYLLSYWGINTNACVPPSLLPPGTIPPGTCMLFVGAAPIGVLAPYKSNNFTVLDGDSVNDKWFLKMFGNIVRCSRE